ncbi:hypothetical protein CGMCC3_g16761 [Colletotrichum fructicola]|nr:uncharacterized protein CGMCC3_g16761 [Colletotrichum fructicola]KAE9567097.1 hypothetical protein CGMCC3_g16761 [Colletotrichum fructicola]
MVDKQQEATKALATGSLALFNQNDSFADAFKMARRLGPKCRRHLKKQYDAVMWPTPGC